MSAALMSSSVTTRDRHEAQASMRTVLSD